MSPVLLFVTQIDFILYLVTGNKKMLLVTKTTFGNKSDATLFHAANQNAVILLNIQKVKTNMVEERQYASTDNQENQTNVCLSDEEKSNVIKFYQKGSKREFNSVIR